MISYGAIRALKEANKSQSRLIEKLTTRNKTLEGVVEVASRLLIHLQYGTDEGAWYCECCGIEAENMPIPHEDWCDVGIFISMRHKLEKV